MAAQLSSAGLPGATTSSRHLATTGTRHLGPAGITYISTLQAGKTQLKIDSEAFLLYLGSGRMPPLLVNRYVEFVDSKGEIPRNPKLASNDPKYKGTQTGASGEAAESIFYKFLDKVDIS